LGTPFIELQSVDSTNNYALAQIHAKLAQPGTCYFAHEQTSGKGQKGKTWATERGMNVIISIVLKPDFLQPIRQFQLSACVAVATHQLFSKYCGSSLKIKWPNDMYWKDRKLGGILIENIVRSGELAGTWDWSVVGIGININQVSFADDIKNAISLKQVTGNSFDQIDLAKKLCLSIDHFIRGLWTTERRLYWKCITDFFIRKSKWLNLKKTTASFQLL